MTPVYSNLPMVLQLIFDLHKRPVDYKHPLPTVYTHCTFKGFQLGLTAAPLFAFFKLVQKRSYGSFLYYNMKYARNGAFLGMLFANSICYYITGVSSLEKNQSRAWRLHRNWTQARADYITLGAMVLGVVLNNALKILWIQEVFMGSAMIGAQIGLFFNYSWVLRDMMYNNNSLK